ncbi:MAG TPA: electron transfer flavoprotein-ubiquinone oxidoreductase [Steroidobacteraceae bacterium]|nr:electron transfer flavoprotein-ubiquinone oxidoreductase [Steroidobacteraceae bacterium]
MSDTARDVMEYEVAIVGAGPAGLAAAIRLKQLRPDLAVCVLEKGANVGAHSLSGAVMEPGPLDALLPHWREHPPAVCVPASRDEFCYLTRRKRWRLPTPPQMANHGNFIVSLGQLTPILAAQAEGLGVDVFAGFAAAEALIDDGGAVRGVRIGDMGVDKSGERGANFAPGPEIHAKLTMFAEGCRGSTAKQLIRRYRLDEGKSPQTYGLGFKELWQLPPGRSEPGLIQHSLGWPLDARTYGGSFLYHLASDRVYIGFVVGLDYEDPRLKPFEAFQQFKNHPQVKPLLEGGEILAAGARTLIEGGFQSTPTLEMPGAVLIGDAGGTLNTPKIKGIHQAIRSGVAAAEHYAETGTSAGFDRRWRESAGGRELRKVRNIRPGFRHGLWFGLANAVYETVTMGKSPWTLANHADHSALKKLDQVASVDRGWGERVLPPRDRLASVFFAATAHEENQPVHLHVADTAICSTRCAREFGNPCTNFCPAGVYEMIDDGAGGRKLQINAANCVHCKACDIKEPYPDQITWCTPEGGSGPNYQGL